MMNLLRLPEDFIGRRHFRYEDDFQWYVTAHALTSVLTDSGTAAVGDAHGGGLVLSPSDGGVSDEDEAYVKSTNELFLFSNNKPLLFEAIINYSEAATNAANVGVGFCSAVAADTLRDAGAGMQTSFSGAVIYKVDGGTVWKCKSSIGSTATDSTSTSTAGGGVNERLRIEVRVVNSYAEVSYFRSGVNDLISSSTAIPAVPLIDSTTLKPIKHTFAITSATEMNAFIGVKNGTAAQQAVTVKRIAWAGAF